MKAETDNNVPDIVFIKVRPGGPNRTRVDEHGNVVVMKRTFLLRRQEFSKQSGTLRLGHKTLEQHDREHVIQREEGRR